MLLVLGPARVVDVEARAMAVHTLDARAGRIACDCSAALWSLSRMDARRHPRRRESVQRGNESRVTSHEG